MNSESQAHSSRINWLLLGVILWMANFGLSIYCINLLNEYDSHPPKYNVLSRSQVDVERIGILFPAMLFNPVLFFLGPTGIHSPVIYWVCVGAGATMLPLFVIGCAAFLVWLKRHADAD